MTLTWLSFQIISLWRVYGMCLLVLLWLKCSFKILTCVRISSWTNSSTVKLAYVLKKIKFKPYLNFQNALMKISSVIHRIKFMSNSKVFCIFKQCLNLCKMYSFHKRIFLPKMLIIYKLTIYRPTVYSLTIHMLLRN